MEEKYEKKFKKSKATPIRYWQILAEFRERFLIMSTWLSAWSPSLHYVLEYELSDDSFSSFEVSTTGS